MPARIRLNPYEQSMIAKGLKLLEEQASPEATCHIEEYPKEEIASFRARYDKLHDKWIRARVAKVLGL